MKSWEEVLHGHYRERFGEPTARFATEPERYRESFLQLLCFPQDDGSTVLCTIGVHDLPGSSHREVVTKVRGAVPDDFPFVYLNALYFLFKRLGLVIRHGLCAPVIESVSPTFAQRFRKTALLFRRPPRDFPLPTAKNGRLMLDFIVCSLVTEDEAAVVDCEGTTLLLETLSQKKTDLADLSRPSAITYSGRSLPPEWRTIDVPEGSEDLAFQLGARFDEEAERWGVPPDVDVYVFEPWYSTQTRIEICLAGAEPRLVMHPDEIKKLREAEVPTSVPFAQSSFADTDRAFTYQLTTYDQNNSFIETNILVRGGWFEYAGHFYEVRGGLSETSIVKCDEVSPIKDSALRGRLTADMLAFLRARSPIGADIKGTDEESITAAVLAMLEEHFQIERQCWGEHPAGRNLCVDAILRPKDVSGWANKDVALAIEFKSPKRVRTKGHKDAAIMAQCLDYSLCKFRGYPTVLVFACPLPAYLRDERYFLSFLARYQVGWMDLTWKSGLQFILGDDVVWDQARGVCDLGRRSAFPKRYGNRDGDGRTP